MLAVSIVVVSDDGRILLKKREKEPDQGKWELFAGYPYLDELPLEKAVRRILIEKAGIGDVASILFYGKFYDDPGRHPGQVCVPLVFIVNVSKNIVISDNKKWFSMSEIKELPMALDNKATLNELYFT